MSQIVQRRDIDFVLFEMLGLEDLFRHDYFAAHDRETVSAVLDTAEAIAEDHFLPLAPVLDTQEPQFVDGKVAMSHEAATALATYAGAGMFAMSFSEADGGLQLPYVISVLANGIFAAANVSLANYANLTVANTNLPSVFCTPAQVVAAARALPAATGTHAAFYQGKMSTCRYFFRYELPKVFAQFELVAALDDTCFNFEAEHFGAVA